MSKRVSDYEAFEFRRQCEEVLAFTGMPARELSQILGYSRGAGLAMARKHVKPSRESYEKMKELHEEMLQHMETK